MGHSVRYISDVVSSLCFGGLAVIGIWVLYTCWSAWYSIRTADRDDYYVCDLHGAVRATDMLTMVDADADGPAIKMCPVCYTTRMKEAYENLTKRNG